MITIGVISDTHIPDRASRLHVQVLPIFERAGVQAILHAGDVCSPAVLDELGKLAPVHAVRGNRDWVLLRSLPFRLELSFDGITVGMIHGHGLLREYLADRAYRTLHGFDMERYQQRVLAAFPQAQVIVYGHIHRPVNLEIDGRLVFNPGSPHFPDVKPLPPSIGLLRLEAGKPPRGEIIALDPGRAEKPG